MDIAASSVSLSIPSQYALTVPMPVSVDHTRAAAKFSKKKAKLTITVPVHVIRMQ